MELKGSVLKNSFLVQLYLILCLLKRLLQKVGPKLELPKRDFPLFFRIHIT